jgi:uncharacterized metal-binding protein YceD (DUF177 family)
MSKHHTNECAWSLPVVADEIPETAQRIDMRADVHIREAVAKIAGVPAVARLEAEFDLTRHGRDGVRVVGRVLATIEQQCVLTLDPMMSELEEAIELVFVPQNEMPSQAGSAEKRLPQGEPIETLRDGVVDLGAIATEFLILGIDPYPRKPGAVFDASQAKENVAAQPFAALAALKKGKSGQGD